MACGTAHARVSCKRGVRNSRIARFLLREWGVGMSFRMLIAPDAQPNASSSVPRSHGELLSGSDLPGKESVWGLREFDLRLREPFEKHLVAG